ncbi:MAG: VCBS repeat-containing protein, partial [Verrucomicrobiales bacterium]|nr:VCBS repeat-containing protein [Verrucomicrobiales bacterium]
MTRRFIALSCLAAATLAVASVGAVAAAAPATNPSPPAAEFGFVGREIFPIENQISLLHAADLDGDGLTDLVVANNLRSKIMLLYNQTGRTNRVETPLRKRELNELPPDARFRIESLASEKRITAMVVTDLNGDRQPDIACYGEPKELLVLQNRGTNGWSAPKRWPITDGQLTQNALTAGDLNGDGRTDLLLLAENHIYFFAQQPDQTLGEPEKIPFASPVKAMQVVDVDGDGRSDLLLVNWDSATPFRFRLQEGGRLGPEIYFNLPPIRAYWADALETNQRTYLITIALSSGRAQIAEFRRRPAEPLAGAFREGQFQVQPLRKTDKARRGVAWADLNRDGRADLLVAEPESGQLSVYLQLSDGSLAAPKTFPSLAGVSDIAVADWDADGRSEIFLLSLEERQVGVTRLEEGDRLPFPTLLPLDGRPLALAVGALQPGGKPTLAVITERDDRRALVLRTADGKSRLQRLSESFKANPAVLAVHDVNQDGLDDLVALAPYEKVKVLLQQAAGRDFEEQDVSPPGGVLEAPWLASADVDGDGRAELLLPQKNFLRAVVLRKELSTPGAPGRPTWSFQVKDQINGAGSDSRLAGVAALRNATNPAPALFLLDVERKILTLTERDGGLWRVTRNVPLPIADFARLQPVGLGDTNANAIALLGLN